MREADAVGVKVNEFQFLPIRVLEDIPAADAPAIAQALDVQTVRDLALYPPYKAAQQILNAVYFPENVPDFDPERPADLLPKTVEYPTERVQYTTLLMDEIQIGDANEITSITGPNFQPLDLTQLAAGDAGFKRIAFGALLTINHQHRAHGSL